MKIGIIGRPNVGKSSLFNALLGFRRAIVLDLPGTTRDEVAEHPAWSPAGTWLVDSQGLYDEKDTAALDSIVSKSSALLFVVDATTGVTPFDEWLSAQVKRTKLPVLLCINKSEDKGDTAFAEFSRLGFDEMQTVSAAHRQNLDAVREWCLGQWGESPSVVEGATEEEPLHIALVGRPNSGKSTLMNHLCGERVSRVSPEPLTTRDPVSFELPTRRGTVRLIDTAGVRRPRSNKEKLEIYSIQATTRMIRGADVVFLLIASHEQVTDQDMRLFSLIEREGKPMAVLLNFWDRLSGEEKHRFLEESDFGRVLRRVTTLPVSGLTGFQTDRILPLAWRLAEGAGRRVRTSRLNRFVEALVARNPPPARGRQNFNILYASQVRVKPPTFVFFMNRRGALPPSYQRYVENSLQRYLGFRGQTIRVFFRSSE